MVPEFWIAVWASLVFEGAAITYWFKRGRWKKKVI
jgi:Na+-driven multidrug efflux pump